MTEANTIAALAAKYIQKIGPETTSGQMIGLLSSIAQEAYSAGHVEGTMRGSEIASQTMLMGVQALLGPRA